MLNFQSPYTVLLLQPKLFEYRCSLVEQDVLVELQNSFFQIDTWLDTLHTEF